MLQGDSKLSETPDSRSVDGIDFDPSTAAADELFVVLDRTLLETVLDVFEPVDANAQLCAESGTGIRLKSRPADCYYLETHVGTNELDAFRPDGTNRQVALEALEGAVAETTADRVALHGDTDGTLVVRDGDEVYDVTASETPLGRDHTAIMAVDRAANELDFTVETTTLRPLVEANGSCDRVRIAADTGEGTADIGLVDGSDDVTDSTVEVAGGEFVDPPSVNLGIGDTAAEREFARPALDAACPPMEGRVTVGLPSGPDAGVNVEYTRANGAVTVWARLEQS